MTMTITFEKNFTGLLLEALGYKKDKQGFIIDAKSKERVKSITNEFIKYKEFGGIAKGKDGKNYFIKDNIFDVVHFVQMQEDGFFSKQMFDLKTRKMIK